MRRLGQPFSRRLMRPIGIGPSAGVRYLFRDTFRSNAAAPLTSPRTAEPGPGSLTLIQTDGQFSIASNALAFPVQTTPAWGDQSLYSSGSLARKVGRALICDVTVSSGSLFSIAWGSGGGGNQAQIIDLALLFSASGVLSVVTSAGVTQTVTGTWTAGVTYTVALVLRASGMHLIIKGGVFGTGTRLFVTNSVTTSNLGLLLMNNAAAGTVDNLRIVDLSGSWSSEYGGATTRLVSPAALTQATHTANGLLAYSFTYVAGTDLGVMYRMTDTSNTWYAYIGTTGNMVLYERVSGSLTARISLAGGTVTAGAHRMLLLFDGNIHRLYLDNVLRGSYTDPSNLYTGNTTFRLHTAGSAPTEMVAWPRTVTLPSV